MTCLEVDFPIVPVNEVAAVEGSSGATRKEVYQMSKWWARRNSSVFRSMLIAAATKAPDDPAEAAKTVWDAYYGNHQARGAFQHLKVADIFMGGGTTVVEGSRLGMQMFVTTQPRGVVRGQERDGWWIERSRRCWRRSSGTSSRRSCPSTPATARAGTRGNGRA